MVWRVARVAVPTAATVVGGTYAYCVTCHDRETDFWRRMLFPAIHYRLVDRVTRNWSDHDREKAFEPLHEKYAPRVERLVLDHRGLYIKLTNRADVLPPIYMRLCEQFQDECPMQSVRGEALKKIVAKELGVESLDSIFREFNGDAFASASIGQVHRAKLLDGSPVAVKIQHPDAEAMFRRDLKTQQTLCRICAPVHLPSLREIEKQFKTEFDYRLEAENLALIRSNIMPLFADRVVVPTPYLEYTTKNILTMEFVEGEKMTTRLRRQLASLALERNTTEELLMQELRQRPPLTHGEIRRANLLRTAAWVAECAYRQVRNAVTLYGVLASSVPCRPQPTPLLDIPSLMDVLVEVHGHEMLIDGAFNGDPHGGNILICPDGRLGLIDYGQVKKLSDDKRRKIARMMCSLIEDDAVGVSRVCKETGMIRTEKMESEPELLQKRIHVVYNYDDFTTTENMNIQVYMEELDDEDPLVFLDDDCIMPTRLSLMMRGMGLALHYPIRTAERWYHMARRARAEIGER